MLAVLLAALESDEDKQKFTEIYELYPRRSTHKSVQHSVAENEVHQCQAAVSAYQYVLPLNAQQLCHQTFGFWNAVQATIHYSVT